MTHRSPTRPRLLTSILAVTMAGSLGLLSACSADAGGGSDGGSAAYDAQGEIAPGGEIGPGGDQATADKDTASSGAGAGAPVEVLTPQIITTGQIAVTVKDAPAAADAMIALVEGFDGSVASDHRSGTDRSERAVLVVRVPPKQFKVTVDQIAALGEETSRTFDAEDVSTTVADVNARIEALQISIDRMLALSATAATTTDLLKIEEQITYRQMELDSLKAQQKALTDQVSLATLTVTLAETPTEEKVVKAGFAGNLAAGWDDLVDFGAGVFALLGRLLPWLTALALLVVPGVLVWRRRRAIPVEPSEQMTAPAGRGPSSGQEASAEDGSVVTE